MSGCRGDPDPPSPQSEAFCQFSRQWVCSERQDGDRSVRRHDVQRDAGAFDSAGSAESGGDDLVVTASRAEEVAEFAVLFAEAVGGVMAREAAHTSDPALDAAMVLLKAVVKSAFQNL